MRSTEGGTGGENRKGRNTRCIVADSHGRSLEYSETKFWVEILNY